MIRWVARILGFLVLVPVVGLFGLWVYLHFVQSPTYAGRYFDGLADVERIEASRRWHWGAHPWGGRAFGCTFAIATLPETASPVLPLRIPPKRHPWNWPSEGWIETPVVTEDGHHPIFEECAYALDPELATRLRVAHDEPGSVYVAGQEMLFLYAPQHRLIARIRFGD